jgi:hypothetical protein
MNTPQGTALRQGQSISLFSGYGDVAPAKVTLAVDLALPGHVQGLRTNDPITLASALSILARRPSGVTIFTHWDTGVNTCRHGRTGCPVCELVPDRDESPWSGYGSGADPSHDGADWN